MSGIGGKKNERTGEGFQKKIGMAEWEVICFNPTREKLTEILGTEPEKDQEYLGDKDGVTTLRVSIWIRDVKTKFLTSASIFLEDREVLSKEREGDPTYVQKNQYINKRGKTVYAASESELSENFKKYEYHIAKVGEADLTSFLDAWLDLDRREDYSLTPDWKKLMKGSLKEFEDLQKSDLPRTVTTMATVRKNEKDDKEYQGIHVRRWLPGYVMKFFRIGNYTPQKVKALQDRYEEIKIKNRNLGPKDKRTYLKDYEYYIIDVADPEWGVKDAYSLQELKDYSADEYMVTSSRVSTATAVSEDDSDY